MRARAWLYEDEMQDFWFSEDNYTIKDNLAVSTIGEEFYIKPGPNSIWVGVNSDSDEGIVLFPESHPYYNFGLIFNNDTLQDTWNDIAMKTRAMEDIMGYFYLDVIDRSEILATL
jgi:hypothetical protein